MKTCKVSFEPEDALVQMPRGCTVLEAAQQAGIYVHSVCGGEGICGKCRVQLKSGNVYLEHDTPLLNEEEKKEGIILACEAKVFEDVTIFVPPESRADAPEILLDRLRRKGLDLYSEVEELEREELTEARLLEHSPLATKIYLQLPPPNLQDTIDDLERVERELRRCCNVQRIHTSLINIRTLGPLLRKANWKVTATLGKRNGVLELVLLEEGDTSSRNFGVAVDVGTTTVVATLVDLVKEKSLATVGTYNKQATYGDDVISRIIFASQREGLEKLHQAVVENVNSLIASLVKKAGIQLPDVMAVMCAGNPTMIHLLLNIDPTYIRKEPYVPTASLLPVIRAAEAGIRINPRGLLACMPGVSSYVGGDVVAGVLASEMATRKELCMLIDMGTNGEIALGNRDWLVCCACSVGPAFEGSGIRCGMRASRGAIQSVRIDAPDHPVYRTISGDKPRGICGSAMIDLLAEMLKAGIINKAGRIQKDSSCQRIVQTEDGLAYVIAPASETATGREVLITQADLDNLLRAKAAVFAGARVLLRKMQLTFEDVHTFYIAGAFGNYLNLNRAISIGLLPDLDVDKFQYIGNGSIAGARLALLYYEAMNAAREIADKMTYIELSLDNMFTEEFTAAMFLPHTDATLFRRTAQ
jgi:uncharacterized 2Fe-2S/4Fe-4S cluster protein (DUF4445 family)